LVAAFVGLLAGIGLAFLAIAGLDAVGVDLPDATLVVRPPTVVAAFVVGLAVTFLASIAPAIRATRVPPIAALQGIAIDRSSTSLFRRIAGPVVIVIGLVALAPAFGSDPSTDVLPTVGLGAFLILIGILVAGPVIARPLASVVGSVLPKIKGITGQLARENAIRNPKRTASTAAALMIGVALIGFITIFAASATASVESEVDRGFRGEFVVQSTNSFSFTGVCPELAAQLAEVDGVSSVASYRASEALVTLPDDSGSGTFLGAVDPASFGEVFEVRMEEGELADLEPGGIIVDRQIAESNDLVIGDEVSVTFPGGTTADVTIDAVSDDQTMLGFWTMNVADFGELAPEQYDLQVGIKLDDGVDQEAVRADLEAVVDEYPTVELLDRDEFVGAIAAQITALLNVIYALLALSIIIAFIGIANTLSLSIYERTRELGLLRAVGMSRGQLRSSIRWEAVIVALLGTLLGLLLGIGLSYTMVKALTAFGLGTFSFPVTSVIDIVVPGASRAVLASLGPARRAAKLQILDAIGTE
jgi:putative ABC transport system permease protein